MKKVELVFAAVVFLVPGLVRADLAKHVTFGGFVDTYYAFDFNQPPGGNRVDAGSQLSITPTRSNEFNVNLAYVEAKLSADRVRGRLALQAGTSVQANYAGQPNNPYSDYGLRNIQEATVGYQLAEGFWIDAGIMLSYIGLESFITKDNWLYSRALVSDFSPYYESGVRATWQATPELSIQLNVMNGWQNIFENNTNKAVGFQFAFSPSKRLTLTYNNFYGDEVEGLYRFFNDFIAKLVVTDRLQLAASFDIGLQRNPAGGSSSWYGADAEARYQISELVALAARVQRYYDPDRVMAQPLTGGKFEANGGALEVDFEPVTNLHWRNEVSALFGNGSYYPSKTGTSNNDIFVVTSLAYSF